MLEALDSTEKPSYKFIFDRPGAAADSLKYLLSKVKVPNAGHDQKLHKRPISHCLINILSS